MSRTGSAVYRRRREVLKKKLRDCHLCGNHIDYDLPPNHPMSFSADHVNPVSLGGNNTTGILDAAHLRCNQSRGNRSIEPRYFPEWMGSREW